MTTTNDMPEIFGEPSAHEEKKTAHVSVPANADAASDAGDAPVLEKDVPVPEKQVRSAREKASKEPSARKAASGRAVKTPREKKEKAARPEKRRTFDKSMLPPETRERVDRRLERLHVLGRKTVENMLDMGEEFHGLSADVEDPKDWADLVKEESDYELKTAGNWKAIFAKMGHRRAEILAHKVTPTVLVKLLPANEETIDAVIAAFAEGKRLKVREVKALVDGSKEAGDLEQKPQGGMKALRVLAAAKLTRQQKSVTNALKVIRQTFATALEARRLEKGKLAGELTPIAKLAHRELTEILCDIDPRSLVGGQALRHLKVEDATWARLFDVLYTLAAADAWPDKMRLKDWLVDKVMPLLTFAIDGTDVAAKEDAEVVETRIADDGAANHRAETLSGDVAADPQPEGRSEAASGLPQPGAAEEPKAAPIANPVSPATLPPRKFRPAQSNVIVPGLLSMEAPKRAPKAGAGTIGSNSPA